MASATYAALDKAWRSTCRVLFGEETCPLEKAEPWLAEYIEDLRTEKSSCSGKEITFSTDEYPRGASYAAVGEIDFGKKFAPLSINELKDIDSVAGAVRERAVYTGDVILGNCSYVEGSSNVYDSHFVMNSTGITDAKYVAYTRYAKRGEYVFGSYGADILQHAVKCMGSQLTRCFECNMVQVLSDCYYCAKTQNCRECMFCFGTENASYRIGNTPLPKEKYLALKKKLLAEMADGLKKDGRLISVLDIVQGAARHAPDSRLKFPKEQKAAFDIMPLEKAFSRTSQLVFGRELSGIDKYGKFLQKHVPENVPAKSALSGNEVLVCSYRTHLLGAYGLLKRMATDDELRGIGDFRLVPESLERLEFSIGSLVETLHPVAYTNLDKIAGICSNYKDATVVIDAQDVYRGSAFSWCKKCSHAFWISVSEAVFGSVLTFESSFSMKCFYSKKMMRSLECDSCEACADLYFGHNCENVRDSMFCFNAKNLSHAIGNAPLPPEQYKQVKGALMSQMADELEKRHDLKWDIFNIGAPERK